MNKHSPLFILEEDCNLLELAAEVEAARSEMVKHAATFLVPGGKPSDELIAISQRLDKLVLQYMTLKSSAAPSAENDSVLS